MKLTEQEFLEHELGWGISYDNEAFRNLAAITADQVKGLGIKTVLDFGAGTGVYSDAFYKAGYQVSAFEIFGTHREYMKEKVPHINIIEKPITTDLMAFIETAEHMTDKELNALFKEITPNYILFSSTSDKTDFDEIWGHINVKNQDEWISYFNSLGYELINNFSAPTTWTKLFKLK